MNYDSSIKVRADKKKVFNAIASELDKWWGKVDNPVANEGDEFTISFGRTKWRFVITKFSQYNQITWKCIEAEHFVEGLSNLKEEWLNTELVWTFKENGSEVEVSLMHKGLTPELNCYNICESGWSFFISTSLKNYLETGHGNPRFE
jgi:hypothetical protein